MGDWPTAPTAVACLRLSTRVGVVTRTTRITRTIPTTLTIRIIRTATIRTPTRRTPTRQAVAAAAAAAAVGRWPPQVPWAPESASLPGGGGRGHEQK